MSASPEAPVGFDGHAADYEAQLRRGLAVSGEGPEFFVSGRLAFVRAWWEDQGRPAPRRVVDYGCGIGIGTALVANAFPEAEVLGLDPSSRSIERAIRESEDPRVRFGVLGGSEPPAAEGADLVYLNGVVHHVPPEERPRLYADLASRLAPGGVVALFENNPLNPGTRWVMARIPFDRDAVTLRSGEARRGLSKAGLVPVATRFLFYFPHALRALRPLERFLGALPLGAQYVVLAESRG